MTWLDKLCGPLLNPQYPQIKGTLARRDSHDNIIGKCAEGEIACQNGITYHPWQHTLHDNDFKALGVPDDFILEECLPHVFVDGNNIIVNFDSEDNIGIYIYGLNDSGFTYPEIVEFLQTTFEDAV